MSNCKVSRTRTSWPRSRAASAKARVLYNSSRRDRMTRRIRRSSLFRWPFLQQIFAADIDKKIIRQRFAAEDHAITHGRAIGDGDADALMDRSDAYCRLDKRPLFGYSRRISDNDRPQYGRVNAGETSGMAAIEREIQCRHQSAAGRLFQFVASHIKGRGAGAGVDLDADAPQIPFGEVKMLLPADGQQLPVRRDGVVRVRGRFQHVGSSLDKFPRSGPRGSASASP